MAEHADGFPFATVDEVEVPPLFAAALAKRKERGAQYNVAGVQREDYFPFGHVSHAQMVHTKATRLRATVEDSGFNPDLADLEEHMVDLINYLCFWYEWATKKTRKVYVDEAPEIRL